MTADREDAIRSLFPLVRALARRVHRLLGRSDVDDLVGDGCIGLIAAVDRFDPNRGTPLEFFARRTIVGAMLNGLRRRDPVSERVRRTIRRAEERRYALAQELFRMPSLAELERSDASLARARAVAERGVPLSLDGPLDASVARVRRPENDDPAEVVLARARRHDLDAALALLTDRQRRILALHYGEERVSLPAIGRRFAVSPQRISQLHLAALAQLRATLGA